MLVLLVMVSCSGTGSVPTVPVSDLTNTTSAVPADGNTQLWGLWDIYIDPDNGSIDAVPIRGASFTANVNRFVDGPPVNVILDIVEVIPDPEGIRIDINIGIQHPFPGLERFTGFDVLGVFMGNGNGAYPGPDEFPISIEMDQRMLNPDGFTRWMNATEFSGLAMPMLGYVEGGLGTTDYVPTAILNPYKYFTDGLGTEMDAFDHVTLMSGDRGSFRPSSVNYRRFELYFPFMTSVVFQYAVIARWEPNVNDPDPPGDLNDFPPSANAPEAVVTRFADNSTAWYVNDTSFGGDIILDITPVDFHKPDLWDDEYAIYCYSDAWTGGFPVIMTPTYTGDITFTFHAEIPVELLQSNDDLPVWVEIRYPDKDYSNDLGVPVPVDGALAGYFRVMVPILTESPEEPWIEVLQPNGGETWYIGGNYEITWDSMLVPEHVRIEYSKDNFVSDVQTIVPDTGNDGSFDWASLPNDPSDTVRVRITSFVNPLVTDDSDEDFTIAASSGEYIYGFADHGLFLETDEADNAQMFTNMFNIPLTGPYAENDIVMLYIGHGDDFWYSSEFENHVINLGYTFVINADPTVDVTGVRMLIVSFMFPGVLDTPYSPEDILAIEGFINGGGLCLVMSDNAAVMDSTTSINTFLDQMGAEFYMPDPGFENSEAPHTDITADPLTTGIYTVSGNVGGWFEVEGEAVSLVRDNEMGGHVICKSPIE